MTTYRKQSKQPKLQTKQQIIDRFKRDMERHGYTVLPVYGSGRYSPALEVSVWPKLQGETPQARKAGQA